MLRDRCGRLIRVTVGHGEAFLDMVIRYISLSRSLIFSSLNYSLFVYTPQYSIKPTKTFRSL